MKTTTRSLAPPANASPIRSVLMATDFLDGSDAALGWASAICRHHGARLVLFHALPGRAAGTDPRYPQIAPSIEELRDAVARKLKAQADSRALDDVEIRVEAQLDPPGQAILEAASACEADLVVIASSRLHGAARWLSESVLAEVIEAADRPLLVVHAEDAGFQGPLGTLMCATNHGEPPKRLLELGLTLLPTRPEVRVIVLDLEGDHPRKVVPEYAREQGADLLAMQVSRPSPFLDLFRVSDSEAAAVRAPCPLLLWPWES